MFILINRITLSECVFMGKSYSMHPEVLNGKVTMRGKGPVASEFPIFLLLGFFYVWDQQLFTRSVSRVSNIFFRFTICFRDMELNIVFMVKGKVILCILKGICSPVIVSYLIYLRLRLDLSVIFNLKK